MQIPAESLVLAQSYIDTWPGVIQRSNMTGSMAQGVKLYPSSIHEPGQGVTFLLAKHMRGLVLEHLL